MAAEASQPELYEIYCEVRQNPKWRVEVGDITIARTTHVKLMHRWCGAPNDCKLFIGVQLLETLARKYKTSIRPILGDWMMFFTTESFVRFVRRLSPECKFDLNASISVELCNDICKHTTNQSLVEACVQHIKIESYQSSHIPSKVDFFGHAPTSVKQEDVTFSAMGLMQTDSKEYLASSPIQFKFDKNKSIELFGAKILMPGRKTIGRIAFGTEDNSKLGFFETNEQMIEFAGITREFNIVLMGNIPSEFLDIIKKIFAREDISAHADRLQNLYNHADPSSDSSTDSEEETKESEDCF